LALWLARLHVNSARSTTQAEMENHVFQALQNAGKELAFSQREGVGMRRLYDTAVTLSKESPLPLVYNHNDLGAPNVMCIAGKFRGVVDWESGGFGLPGTDLIYFLGSFAHVARSGGSEDQLMGFKEMFFESDTLASGGSSEITRGIAQRWLGDYCRRLGISVRWLPVLFGLCWTMHARNEKRQAEEQTGSESSRTPGYFRECLRFYLENMERLSIVESAAGRAEARAE
jgi:aminoglycoside phosphotransferase (APT) family kinase protein